MTRGQRNNNFGNIKISKTPWRGKVPLDENTDGIFEQFVSPEYGLRALIRLLKTYITKRKNKTDTIRKVVARYAPGEDYNDVDGYTYFLARKIGIKENQRIYFEKEFIYKLVKFICLFENGKDLVDEILFSKAWDLANVD